MQITLFNVRPRRASNRNTVNTYNTTARRLANHDPYAILASLDTEFDSFGECASAHDVEHVAPGLVALDGPEGPRVRRAA